MLVRKNYASAWCRCELSAVIIFQALLENLVEKQSKKVHRIIAIYYKCICS